MDVYETLITRNAHSAGSHFTAGLRMMPSLRTIVIGCVDPRVDPTVVLGTEPGEVAAIRNVGGRVTPETRRELSLLRGVTQAAGGDFGPAWEFIVLQHTDCGITRLADAPGQLAGYFGVAEDQLAALAVSNPRAAVAADVAALRADPELEGVRISGLVYDVATGLTEVVASP